MFQKCSLKISACLFTSRLSQAFFHTLYPIFFFSVFTCVHELGKESHKRSSAAARHINSHLCIYFYGNEKNLYFSGLSFVTEGSGGSVYFSNCKNQSVLKSHFLIDQASLQWYVLKKFVDSSTHLQLGSL